MTKNAESEWIWIEGLHVDTGEWVGLYNFDRTTGLSAARSTLKRLLDLDDEQLLAKHGLTAMEDFRVGGIGRNDTENGRDAETPESAPPEDPLPGKERPLKSSESASKGSKARRTPNGDSEAPGDAQKAKRKRCREKHPKQETRCIKKVTHTDLHRDLEGRRW